MYRVDRNNFYANGKRATVYTPAAVSEFVFSAIAPRIDPNKTVLDPCVGRGALLRPFDRAGYKTLGVDVARQGYENTVVQNYLAATPGDFPPPAAVLMNPPFNIDETTRQYIKENYGGRPLLPEIWLQKTLDLFGKDAPAVLFAPYGLRLNQNADGKRWQKFVRGDYPEISSIISLPKNIFDGVLFHSEILVFNIRGLKPHYFFGG